MKTLYESLLDDFDTLVNNADPRKTIEEFLDQNFSGTWHISDKPNKDGYYEVSSNFSIHGLPTKLSSLTNGLFIWTKVKGSFSCQHCAKLTSLEGGPKEVGKIYCCSYCPNLKTLKGGPDFAGHFDCSWNDNLVSLEGGPKTVQYDFLCSYCPKLKSLKGAPKITGKCFTCNYCGEKFSVEDVQKYTKTKKNNHYMKTLYESLLDDFDTLASKVDPRKEVEEFLKLNVDELKKLVISKTPNKDGVYEVSSRGNVTFFGRNNPNGLTNGLFIWTKVKGDFDCAFNDSLETLEGGPQEIGGTFNCGRCPNLVSLEGAPKKIGGNFECDFCEKLLSLKGIPETIPGDFTCSYCSSLRTLKDGPKEVSGNFYCAICGKTFTRMEVYQQCDVAGRTVV